MSSDVKIVPFAHEHLPGAIELFAAEGWSYAKDEQRTWRALTAPGSLSLVALSEQAVVGIAQVLSDGEIQAFLAIVLVAPAHRRQGVRAAPHRRGARPYALPTARRDLLRGPAL